MDTPEEKRKVVAELTEMFSQQEANITKLTESMEVGMPNMLNEMRTSLRLLNGLDITPVAFMDVLLDIKAEVAFEVRQEGTVEYALEEMVERKKAADNYEYKDILHMDWKREVAFFAHTADTSAATEQVLQGHYLLTEEELRLRVSSAVEAMETPGAFKLPAEVYEPAANPWFRHVRKFVWRITTKPSEQVLLTDFGLVRADTYRKVFNPLTETTR